MNPASRAARLIRALMLPLATLASLSSGARAQAADVLRGHVRATNEAPLAGATVTATARDRSTRTARTDAQGAWTVSFPGGSGPYTVGVTLIGFVAQNKPAPEPGADGSRPDLEFRLEQTVQRLAPVTTRAVRTRPQRSDADRTGVGEAGRDNLTGAIGGDLSGDIAAAMGTVPGLLIIPDPNGGLPGISAFGLSADQNSLTLNGMNFGAGGVPRDGLVLRVSQATYDPGRGGFSGVQTMLRLPSGSNFVNQTLHVTAEDPSLQGSTPQAAQFGSQYARQILSGAWSGPIAEDKAFYSTSFQFSRRASDFATLATSNAASLQSLGISADSAKRLLSLMQGFGIPSVTPAVPGDRLLTNASFLSRFDWSPNTSSRAGNVLYVLAGGNWSDNAGTRTGPTATAAHGGDTRSWAGQLQVNASRFIGPVLNESNLAFVSASNRTTPYLLLPDARLLINSSFADGTAGSATVRVGGNANAESDSRNSSVQLRNETSWFTMNSRHNFKVTLDGRAESDAATQSANRLGTFAYNSLADFAAGRPASFSRTLASRETEGRQVIGALALGDIWRPYQALRIQYGVRVETNAFGDQPANNPLVESLFGRSTSHVPGAVTVAPMAGFTRQYSSFGGGAFTGGVREYVGTLSSQTVEGVLRQTGLPDAVQQLTCVGAAVPSPAWSTYGSASSIPSQCADGTAGTPFSQTTPPVTVFAPGYDPSRRWGTSLGWNGRVNSSWVGWVTANWSLNQHRPGAFDLNFNPVTRFTLAAEAGRPVYVASTSIVTTTGATASTDSRRHAQFAQVNELRADLRSEARQLIVGLTTAPSQRPQGLGITTSLRAYYTWSDTREQTRGFGGGTTDGDPRAVTWGESGLPQHSFQVLGSISFPGWANVDAFARVSSGRRYTPMVSGDINGDGLSNDRAFVFDPTTAPDATLASGMRALVNGAPKAARDCLTRQRARVATRSSCDGPWTESLNLAVSLDPARLGLGDRGSVSLVITNLLGAVDQMLHGSNHLRYWGTSATPDPVLLNVRGFDPATNRFRYDVNPLFGSTKASLSTGRLPFVISLDVRLRLGPDRDAQMLKGFLQPRPNDNTKALSAVQIKARLDHDAQNNFEDITKRRGGVKLAPAQVDGLNAMAKRFDGYRDSVYADLSAYLASLKGNYLTLEAKHRFHDAFVAIARQYVLAGHRVRALLSEEQFAALPVSMTAYFDMDLVQFERLMKSADFGTLLELITGEGPD